jgi:hypothetical protein
VSNCTEAREGILTLFFVANLLGQQTKSGISQEAYDAAISKSYASRAVPEIRMMMKDPGSFTLIQVVAIVKPNKKDPATPSFRECIRYVASNSYGGRLQACGGYHVNKKAHLTVFPGPQTGGEACSCAVYNNEIGVDVTQEAVNSSW